MNSISHNRLRKTKNYKATSPRKRSRVRRQLTTADSFKFRKTKILGEIQKKEIEYSEIQKKIENAMSEINDCRAYNKNAEKIINKHVTTQKDMLAYSEYCKQSYKSLSEVIDPEKISKKILRDVVSSSKIDWLTFQTDYNFSVSESVSEKKISCVQSKVAYNFEISQKSCNSSLNNSTASSKKSNRRAGIRVVDCCRSAEGVGAEKPEMAENANNQMLSPPPRYGKEMGGSSPSPRRNMFRNSSAEETLFLKVSEIVNDEKSKNGGSGASKIKSVRSSNQSRRNSHKTGQKDSLVPPREAETAQTARTAPNPDQGSQRRSSPLKDVRRRKGFKPTSFKQASKATCDLKPNPSLFQEKIEKLLKTKKRLSTKDKETCRDYFRSHIVDEEHRKELWRRRIGNRLGITRNIFEGLKTRLRNEGYPEETERQIQMDLDRSFPNCQSYKEGRRMYSDMVQILLLFHIYRPDIEYVQGMNDIVIVIYYYFDVFETFVYFSNLVVTHKLVNTVYSFDLEKFAGYHKIFHHQLNKRIPAVMKMIKEQEINTEGFLMGCMFTVYSRAFNIEVVRALWDIYLVFGDYMLLQIGISLFNIIKSQITYKQLEFGFSKLIAMASDIKLSELVEDILRVDVDDKKLDYLVMKLMLAEKKGIVIDMENDKDFKEVSFSGGGGPRMRQIQKNLIKMKTKAAIV